MNTREKKKLKLKYISKVEKALKLEKSKPIKLSNSDHIEQLEELRTIMKGIDFRTFYHGHERFLIPKKLSTGSTYWGSTLSEEMSKLYSDTIINREISLILLGI